MIASTGHTWEQVRNDWDLPRLRAWTAYESDHPPVHKLVASYLGVKPKAKVTATDASNEEAAAFLMSFAGLAHK